MSAATLGVAKVQKSLAQPPPPPELEPPIAYSHRKFVNHPEFLETLPQTTFSHMRADLSTSYFPQQENFSSPFARPGNRTNPSGRGPLDKRVTAAGSRVSVTSLPAGKPVTREDSNATSRAASRCTISQAATHLQDRASDSGITQMRYYRSNVGRASGASLSQASPVENRASPSRNLSPFVEGQPIPSSTRWRTESTRVSQQGFAGGHDQRQQQQTHHPVRPMSFQREKLADSCGKSCDEEENGIARVQGSDRRYLGTAAGASSETQYSHTPSSNYLDAKAFQDPSIGQESGDVHRLYGQRDNATAAQNSCKKFGNQQNFLSQNRNGSISAASNSINSGSCNENGEPQRSPRICGGNDTTPFLSARGPRPSAPDAYYFDIGAGSIHVNPDDDLSHMMRRESAGTSSGVGVSPSHTQQSSVEENNPMSASKASPSPARLQEEKETYLNGSSQPPHLSSSTGITREGNPRDETALSQGGMSTLSCSGDAHSSRGSRSRYDRDRSKTSKERLHQQQRANGRRHHYHRKSKVHAEGQRMTGAQVAEGVLSQSQRGGVDACGSSNGTSESNTSGNFLHLSSLPPSSLRTPYHAGNASSTSADVRGTASMPASSRGYSTTPAKDSLQISRVDARAPGCRTALGDALPANTTTTSTRGNSRNIATYRHDSAVITGAEQQQSTRTLYPQEGQEEQQHFSQARVTQERGQMRVQTPQQQSSPHHSPPISGGGSDRLSQSHASKQGVSMPPPITHEHVQLLCGSFSPGLHGDMETRRDINSRRRREELGITALQQQFTTSGGESIHQCERENEISWTSGSHKKNLLKQQDGQLFQSSVQETAFKTDGYATLSRSSVASVIPVPSEQQPQRLNSLSRRIEGERREIEEKEVQQQQCRPAVFQQAAAAAAEPCLSPRVPNTLLTEKGRVYDRIRSTSVGPSAMPVATVPPANSTFGTLYGSSRTNHYSTTHLRSSSSIPSLQQRPSVGSGVSASSLRQGNAKLGQSTTLSGTTLKSAQGQSRQFFPPGEEERSSPGVTPTPCITAAATRTAFPMKTTTSGEEVLFNNRDGKSIGGGTHTTSVSRFVTATSTSDTSSGIERPVSSQSPQVLLQQQNLQHGQRNTLFTPSNPKGDSPSCREDGQREENMGYTAHFTIGTATSERRAISVGPSSSGGGHRGGSLLYAAAGGNSTTGAASSTNIVCVCSASRVMARQKAQYEQQLRRLEEERQQHEQRVHLLGQQEEQQQLLQQQLQRQRERVMQEEEQLRTHREQLSQEQHDLSLRWQQLEQQQQELAERKEKWKRLAQQKKEELQTVSAKLKAEKKAIDERKKEYEKENLSLKQRAESVERGEEKLSTERMRLQEQQLSVEREKTEAAEAAAAATAERLEACRRADEVTRIEERLRQQEQEQQQHEKELQRHEQQLKQREKKLEQQVAVQQQREEELSRRSKALEEQRLVLEREEERLQQAAASQQEQLQRRHTQLHTKEEELVHLQHEIELAQQQLETAQQQLQNREAEALRQEKQGEQRLRDMAEQLRKEREKQQQQIKEDRALFEREVEQEKQRRDAEHQRVHELLQQQQNRWTEEKKKQESALEKEREVLKKQRAEVDAAQENCDREVASVRALERDVAAQRANLSVRQQQLEEGEEELKKRDQQQQQDYQDREQQLQEEYKEREQQCQEKYQHDQQQLEEEYMKRQQQLEEDYMKRQHHLEKEIERREQELQQERQQQEYQQQQEKQQQEIELKGLRELAERELCEQKREQEEQVEEERQRLQQQQQHLDKERQRLQQLEQQVHEQKLKLQQELAGQVSKEEQLYERERRIRDQEQRVQRDQQRLQHQQQQTEQQRQHLQQQQEQQRRQEAREKEREKEIQLKEEELREREIKVAQVQRQIDQLHEEQAALVIDRSALDAEKQAVEREKHILSEKVDYWTRQLSRREDEVKRREKQARVKLRDIETEQKVLRIRMQEDTGKLLPPYKASSIAAASTGTTTTAAAAAKSIFHLDNTAAATSSGGGDPSITPAASTAHNTKPTGIRTRSHSPRQRYFPALPHARLMLSRSNRSAAATEEEEADDDKGEKADSLQTQDKLHPQQEKTTSLLRKGEDKQAEKTDIIISHTQPHTLLLSQEEQRSTFPTREENAKDSGTARESRSPATTSTSNSSNINSNGSNADNSNNSNSSSRRAISSSSSQVSSRKNSSKEGNVHGSNTNSTQHLRSYNRGGGNSASRNTSQASERGRSTTSVSTSVTSRGEGRGSTPLGASRLLSHTLSHRNLGTKTGQKKQYSSSGVGITVPIGSSTITDNIRGSSARAPSSSSHIAAAVDGTAADVAGAPGETETSHSRRSGSGAGSSCGITTLHSSAEAGEGKRAINKSNSSSRAVSSSARRMRGNAATAGTAPQKNILNSSANSNASSCRSSSQRSTRRAAERGNKRDNYAGRRDISTGGTGNDILALYERKEEGRGRTIQERINMNDNSTTDGPLGDINQQHQEGEEKELHNKSSEGVHHLPSAQQQQPRLSRGTESINAGGSWISASKPVTAEQESSSMKRFSSTVLECISPAGAGTLAAVDTSASLSKQRRESERNSNMLSTYASSSSSSTRPTTAPPHGGEGGETIMPPSDRSALSPVSRRHPPGLSLTLTNRRSSPASSSSSGGMFLPSLTQQQHEQPIHRRLTDHQEDPCSASTATASVRLHCAPFLDDTEEELPAKKDFIKTTREQQQQEESMRWFADCTTTSTITGISSSSAMGKRRSSTFIGDNIRGVCNNNNEIPTVLSAATARNSSPTIDNDTRKNISHATETLKDLTFPVNESNPINSITALDNNNNNNNSSRRSSSFITRPRNLAGAASGLLLDQISDTLHPASPPVRPHLDASLQKAGPLRQAHEGAGCPRSSPPDLNTQAAHSPSATTFLSRISSFLRGDRPARKSDTEAPAEFLTPRGQGGPGALAGKVFSPEAAAIERYAVTTGTSGEEVVNTMCEGDENGKRDSSSSRRKGSPLSTVGTVERMGTEHVQHQQSVMNRLACVSRRFSGEPRQQWLAESPHILASEPVEEAKFTEPSGKNLSSTETRRSALSDITQRQQFQTSKIKKGDGRELYSAHVGPGRDPFLIETGGNMSCRNEPLPSEDTTSSSITGANTQTANIAATKEKRISGVPLPPTGEESSEVAGLHSFLALAGKGATTEKRIASNNIILRSPRKGKNLIRICNTEGAALPRLHSPAADSAAAVTDAESAKSGATFVARESVISHLSAFNNEDSDYGDALMPSGGTIRNCT